MKEITYFVIGFLVAKALQKKIIPLNYELINNAKLNATNVPYGKDYTATIQSSKPIIVNASQLDYGKRFNATVDVTIDPDYVKQKINGIPKVI